MFSPRGPAEHWASSRRRLGNWGLSSSLSWFFSPDRTGCAVFLPLRHGTPVQTVRTINPQYQGRFRFADIHVQPARLPEGVRSFTFSLICTVRRFAAWLGNNLENCMIGLLIGWWDLMALAGRGRTELESQVPLAFSELLIHLTACWASGISSLTTCKQRGFFTPARPSPQQNLNLQQYRKPENLTIQKVQIYRYLFSIDQNFFLSKHDQCDVYTSTLPDEPHRAKVLLERMTWSISWLSPIVSAAQE